MKRIKEIIENKLSLIDLENKYSKGETKRTNGKIKNHQVMN